MPFRRLLPACLLAAVACWPLAVAAGEPVRLADKLFEVTLTDGAGNPAESFAPGSQMVLTVRFGLMMSDVKDYPVTVTMIVGGQTVEAFSGRLREGVWSLSERFDVIANWKPSVPWKVLLRVKMFDRSKDGTESFFAHYRAEGMAAVNY
jgi:hypothetical protein